MKKLTKTQQKIFDKYDTTIQDCKQQIADLINAKDEFMIECKTMSAKHNVTILNTLDRKINKLYSIMETNRICLLRYVEDK